MNDDQPPSVLRDALVREAVGLAVMAAVLWYLGPGKLIVSGWAHRARTVMSARGDVIDLQVAQFRTQVSRWDHEQAAQADRRPGRGGPCECA